MTIIEEIDEPNKYRARDHFSDAERSINTKLPTMVLAVEFIEENGKTKVVNKTITDSTEQLEQLMKMGMVEGFSSQLNKLESLLAD